MDSHAWCGRESDLSFAKVRYVIGLINESFVGDASVQIGIIYIAIGANGGKETNRFVMFIPFYNPTIHGYNFNVQHPYVFARGFAAAASMEFYAWMDTIWTERFSSIENSNGLLECSPILIAEFESTADGSFKELHWQTSQVGAGSMSITVPNVLECWVHGPTASDALASQALKKMKVRYRSEFMQLLKSKEADAVEKLVEFLGDRMTESSSYSFPTIQMSIVSPMHGLVPYPLKDVRLMFGGTFASSDRNENAVHVPIAKPEHETRRISLQRIWDVLIDRNEDVGNCKNHLNKVRSKLL